MPTDIDLRPLVELANDFPSLDRERENLERRSAPQFNSFDVFAPGETRLSRVLGELFDPHGSHGQGALFLNALLARLYLPASAEGEPVLVRREVQTYGKGRIDLVIETQNALIGIENKPWAAERRSQLSDYGQALTAWRGKPATLVFLSPREPQTHDGHVAHITFASDGSGKPSLQDILEEVRPAVEAARVCDFIDQFIEFLDANFGSQRAMKGHVEPYVQRVEAAMSDASTRRAMAAILIAGDRIHEQVLGEIGRYLASEVGPDVECPDGHLSLRLAKRYQSWRMRRPEWPPNLAIALEARGLDGKSMIVGVKAPRPNSTNVNPADEFAQRALLELALQTIPGGAADFTAHFAWGFNVPDGHWGRDFVGRVMLESKTGYVWDHPAIARIGQMLAQLSDCIEAWLHESRSRED